MLSAGVPDLSVVIPVRNGWDTLWACLASLDRQAGPVCFEVTVVDDGSVQPAPRDLASRFSRFSLTVKRQTPLGIAAARNAGMAAARGEVIVFLDSDCTLAEDFLLRLTEAISRHPEETAFQPALQGRGDGLVARMEDLRLRATLCALRSDDGRVLYVNTSAFAIRRPSPDELEPLFDVGFVRGEDTAFLARLCAQGRLPLYVPDAVAYHTPSMGLGAYLRKHLAIGYRCGEARASLAREVPESARHLKRRRISAALWRVKEGGSKGSLVFLLVVLAYALERCGRVAYLLVGMRRGRVPVLSARVDPVRAAELQARILDAAQRRQPLSVTYLTAWSLVVLEKDPAFARMTRGFDLCYADGVGVVYAAVLTAFRRLKKVTANDFFFDLCQEAANRGLSLALIGGTAGKAGAVAARLRSAIPDVKISLCSSGYFDDTAGAELLRQLASARPHIVFLGMGQPAQERWAVRHRESLPDSVLYCVGGLFDYILDTFHAPRWVRHSGLEWVCRLARFPRQTWRRYLVGIPLLVYYIARADAAKLVLALGPWWARRHRRATADALESPEAASGDVAGQSASLRP